MTNQRTFGATSAGIVSLTMNTTTDYVTVARRLGEKTMLRANRAEIEQQISDIIDEVSVQDLVPSVALRQIMYFLDIYGHKQEMIGMDKIVELYNKRGVKL
jgi:glutamate formiminotransferase